MFQYLKHKHSEWATKKREELMGPTSTQNIPEEVLLPIIQVGNEQAFTPEETIYVLTRFLANQCDGARDIDGVGFNRMHTQMGKSLAARPFHMWTDKQLWAARRMLSVYKNTQLAPWWEHVPEVEHPNDRVVVDIHTKQPVRRIPVDRRMSLEVIDGETFVSLKHDYDQQLVNTIKSLPRQIRRWDQQRMCWLMPLEYEVLEQVAEFATEWGYELEPEVMDRVDGILVEVGEKVDLSHAAEGHVEIEGFGGNGLKLRPFQAAAVQYALKVLDPAQSKGMLDADEMGLGKTPTGIAIAKAINAETTVVICPASVKWNWKREIERWIPGATAHVIQGGKTYPLRRRHLFGEEQIADFFIIGYSAIVFAKWRPILAELDPDIVIMDEIHNLKNEETKQHKEIYGFLQDCRGKIVPVGLSGTPLVNTPKDFANIVKLVGHTDVFGWSGDPDDKAGHQRFLATFDSMRSGTELRKLNAKARQNFMVRRLKKDVLTELPPKVRQIVPIELDNAERYYDAEANVAHYFAQKRIESEKFLRQCIEEYSGVHEDEGWAPYWHERRKEHYGDSYWIGQQHEQLMKWELLKGICLEGKKSGVVQWIDEFLASTDEALICFVSHVEFGKTIAGRYGADFISGSVQPEERQRMVERFQDPSGPRVIVGNLIAAGEGLTLTKASNVAMLELGWNPKTMSQAEDRAHRIGQKDSVNVYTLVAGGPNGEQTIEHQIAEIIMEKQELSDNLADGNDAATQKQIMAELEAKLRAKIGG